MNIRKNLNWNRLKTCYIPIPEEFIDYFEGSRIRAALMHSEYDSSSEEFTKPSVLLYLIGSNELSHEGELFGSIDLSRIDCRRHYSSREVKELLTSDPRPIRILLEDYVRGGN